MAPKTFSNESLSRCDQFYQIFVQIGANLAIFQPFEISIFFRNFERPFTPRNQLRSASNFAKTRFRRSPTFHFSTSKNFFETSNGRLPPKHGSDRRETLPKRVSGDPRHFIFRHPQTFLATKIFVRKIVRQHPENFFNKVPVLEKLCRFTRNYRMQLENSLPDM